MFVSDYFDSSPVIKNITTPLYYFPGFGEGRGWTNSPTGNHGHLRHQRCTSCTQRHWHHTRGTRGSEQVGISRKCCFHSPGPPLFSQSRVSQEFETDIWIYPESHHGARPKRHVQQSEEALWPALQLSLMRGSQFKPASCSTTFCSILKAACLRDGTF